MTTEALPPEIQELRDNLLAEAEERGNAIVTVDEQEGAAGFSFTAGAWRKHGIPEAVVIGLPGPIGPVLLDAYVDRAANGERFVPGSLHDDFFDGVPLTFEHVAKGYYPQFFGSAFAVYPDGDFPALQIIVPTPDGHWPWDPNAPDGFAHWQPVLTESGLPESWRAIHQSDGGGRPQGGSRRPTAGEMQDHGDIAEVNSRLMNQTPR